MLQFRHLGILLALSFSAGCQTVGEHKRESALNSTLYSYQTAMRWGHWDTLISYRGPKAPTVPELDFDNIRVTGYDVRQAPVELKEDTVFQVAEIQYVLNDRQRLRKLYDKQEWRYNPETKQWQLFSAFPAFE